MYSVFVLPEVVLFLVGVFYKIGNRAYWTLMIGTLIGILFFVLQLMGLWELHFTMTVGITVAISTVIFVLVSRATAPPSKEAIELYTFKKDLITMGTEGLPWYKNYLYHIGILASSIFILLIILW